MSQLDELFDLVANCMRETQRNVNEARELLRCEGTRYQPGDGTGENGQQCGMIAGYFCENCHQLLCDFCAEGNCTVYPYEHKILSAAKSEVA